MQVDRVCRYIYHFANMDTLCLGPQGETVVEYILTRKTPAVEAYLPETRSLVAFERSMATRKVLLHDNPYRLRFITAPVSSGGLVVVGPFLLESLSPPALDELLRYHHWPLTLRHMFEQYYLSLPVIGLYRAQIIAEFVQMLLTAQLAPESSDMELEEVYYEGPRWVARPDIDVTQAAGLEDVIEASYRFEDRMLRAVETGDRRKLEAMLAEDVPKLDTSHVVSRLTHDPVRSLKDLCIVYDTLLREAAERGGVPPVYLHSLSTRYLSEIESCINIHQLQQVVNKMPLDYCDAVRHFAVKGYSPIVRLAINHLRLGFTEAVDLRSLAKKLGVSPYTLSKKFKRETGLGLVEYVHRLRIDESLYLLRNKTLQISDVALMSGFGDVSYFTKVFKKLQGMTPSQYRRYLNIS